MAFNFIKILKQRNIEFFVAPYEADAQLAYLQKIGYVDAVITEDSDLLALGCEKVLFKLNDEGYGDEIDLKNLKQCKEFDLTKFSHDRFLNYCILSGCDYFKLRGVGYKTAYQAVKDCNTYQESLNLLSRNKMENNPRDMIELFEKAFLTFKFQVVYCPKEKRMKYFNDMNDTIYTFLHKYNDVSFLGKYTYINIYFKHLFRIYDDETAHKIVFGIIDPISHKKFEETKNDIVHRMFSIKENKSFEELAKEKEKEAEILKEREKEREKYQYRSKEIQEVIDLVKNDENISENCYINVRNNTINHKNINAIPNQNKTSISIAGDLSDIQEIKSTILFKSNSCYDSTQDQSDLSGQKPKLDSIQQMALSFSQNPNNNKRKISNLTKQYEEFNHPSN
jgi:5'-3' exonuclease